MRRLSSGAPRADLAPMQKLFGIAVIVGLIWLGLSIFTQGTQATFAWLPWVDKNAPADPSPLERFRAKGESARDAAEQRVERQLDDRRAANEDDE
jgi:hypothetical protein